MQHLNPFSQNFNTNSFFRLKFEFVKPRSDRGVETKVHDTKKTMPMEEEMTKNDTKKTF